MTQIDFYILDENSDHEVDTLACRLAEKALQRGSRIYLQCREPEQVQAMDQLLWSFRDSSFLPHSTDHQDAECPIGLGTEDAPEHHHDLLINLSGRIPQGYARFERILELVPAEHEARAASRENYAHYRDRGYPIENHRIS